MAEDRARYLGTNKVGPAAVADLHFPGLAPEAARWLVEHRSIKSIGLDTPSIDHGQSKRFPSHVTLCEHNIPAFENVANLERLPMAGAILFALPMKDSPVNGTSASVGRPISGTRAVWRTLVAAAGSPKTLANPAAK